MLLGEEAVHIGELSAESFDDILDRVEGAHPVVGGRTLDDVEEVEDANIIKRSS
jgi:hypothetical protein